MSQTVCKGSKGEWSGWKDNPNKWCPVCLRTIEEMGIAKRLWSAADTVPIHAPKAKS